MKIFRKWLHFAQNADLEIFEIYLTMAEGQEKIREVDPVLFLVLRQLKSGIITLHSLVSPTQ